MWVVQKGEKLMEKISKRQLQLVIKHYELIHSNLLWVDKHNQTTKLYGNKTL